MERIYMDNGATSFPKAPGVVDAMCQYIAHNGTNIGRGSYGNAIKTGLRVLETREKLKELFGFPWPAKNVVFTPGATYGLNQILTGYLHSGDHVIVSSLEHNSVMRPLYVLARKGVEVSLIPADRQGRTKAVDILPLLRPNTKLVMVSHASNVCGTIFPLEEVAEICHAVAIPLAVDGAQTAGHLPIDFGRLHLSVLCLPGHKGLLGPQGVGALLLDPTFAKEVTPLVVGGTGSGSDLLGQPSFMPDRFESGTLNLPNIIGLHAALSYVEQRGILSLHQHLQALVTRFVNGLPTSNVTLIGAGDAMAQTGVISLNFPQRDNSEISYLLERKYGILTRCGLHCAPQAHKTLDTYPCGTVRFSFGYQTTEQDIDKVLDAIWHITT